MTENEETVEDSYLIKKIDFINIKHCWHINFVTQYTSPSKSTTLLKNKKNSTHPIHRVSFWKTF